MAEASGLSRKEWEEIGYRMGWLTKPEDVERNAAAPDLLQACRTAYGMMARQLIDGRAADHWLDDEHEAYAVLGRAIAKAEGR